MVSSRAASDRNSHSFLSWMSCTRLGKSCISHTLTCYLFPTHPPHPMSHSIIFKLHLSSLQNCITFGTVICMLYYILCCCITSESPSKGPAHLSGVVFAPHAKSSLRSLSTQPLSSDTTLQLAIDKAGLPFIDTVIYNDTKFY
jgi:hypothetical protein